MADAAQDLEAAEQAYLRVRVELEAVSVAELAPFNVDIVDATSTVLGACPGIRGYRDAIAKLPDFDMRHVDSLNDYATAAWYAHVTNLPASEATEIDRLEREATQLRTKLLSWASPLAESKLFDANAIKHIRRGSGKRDAAGDLVALVALYRAHWHEVRRICAVTDIDLNRAAELGSALFGSVSRRQMRRASQLSEHALRARRAWTLLDNAYSECRRALAYLRFKAGDADQVAPSLRRNAGRTGLGKRADEIARIAQAPDAGTARDRPHARRRQAQANG